MTLPAVMRIFFAIEIPESLKESLERYTATLKKAAKTHGIRWTRPENYHITLQFLAHVKSDDLTPMIVNVRERLRHGVPHPEIRVQGVEVFPSPFRPRVIVLSVSPKEELAVLARVVGEGILKTQYDIEDRPYRPHITLGRIKQPHGINLQFISSVEPPVFDALKPDGITLYRSEPEADGSHYSVIERIPWITHDVTL